MSDIFLNLWNRIENNKSAVLLFSLVLGVGFSARFWGLAWHFTHTDDLGILEYLFLGQAKHNIFYVTSYLTNAPFQYIFTYFLVSPSLDYRELLFWGRLPSCVMGCLALVMLVLFYREYDKRSPEKGFFAIAFVACSWENIAFAKQMHSYAIGVFAATILLFWLMTRVRKTFFSLRDAWSTSLVLALASHMQYQILLFVPAFYLTLLGAHWGNCCKKPVLLRNLFLSVAVYIGLILPMWFFFLKPQFFDFSRKIEWALGSSREYAFNWSVSRGLWGQVVYVSGFFLKNLYEIFESKMAFFPEASLFFKSVMAGLFSFFIFGVIDFFGNPDKKARSFGVFFGLLLLTWWGMAVFRGFPYGPSRYTLILLPFFAVTTAQGLEGLSKVLRTGIGKEIPELWRRRLWIGMGLLVLSIFLVCYGQFLKERKDPINGRELRAVFEAYDVDEVFFDKRGSHLEYLKDFMAFREKMDQKQTDEIRTFAFVTRYPARSPRQRCEECRDVYNYVGRKMILKDGKNVPVKIRQPCSAFYTVFETNVESNVTEGFSRKIKSAILTNRLYFCILSLDPEKKKLASRFGGKA